MFLHISGAASVVTETETVTVTVNAKVSKLNLEARGLRSWRLLGQELSAKCLARLLGMGEARLYRVSLGLPDRRFAFAGPAACPNTDKPQIEAWSAVDPSINQLDPDVNAKVQKRPPIKNMQIDRFLLGQYLDAAGMLPTRLLCCSKYICTDRNPCIARPMSCDAVPPQFPASGSSAVAVRGRRKPIAKQKSFLPTSLPSSTRPTRTMTRAAAQRNMHCNNFR